MHIGIVLQTILTGISPVEQYQQLIKQCAQQMHTVALQVLYLVQDLPVHQVIRCKPFGIRQETCRIAVLVKKPEPVQKKLIGKKQVQEIFFKINSVALNRLFLYAIHG